VKRFRDEFDHALAAVFSALPAAINQQNHRNFFSESGLQPADFTNM